MVKAAAVSVSETIHLVGYVLNAPALERIEELAVAAVSGPDDVTTARQIKTTVTATFAEGEDLEFDSVADLVVHLNKSGGPITRLDLQCRRSYEAAIAVRFWADGDVQFGGYGPDLHYQFKVSRLRREVAAIEPNYGSAVRTLVFKPWLREALAFGILASSLALLFSVIYFFYLKSVIVDIDPSLVSSSDTAYYQRLAAALKSSNTNEKLDMLLRSQVKGFRDAGLLLADVQRWMLFSAVTAGTMTVVAIVFRAIAGTYPRAFFSLGQAVETLRRLERRRDLWLVGVVVALS